MIIHELYGIQAEELERLRSEYSKLLKLISQIQSGDIDVNAIKIEDNSWRVVTDEEPLSVIGKDKLGG